MKEIIEKLIQLTQDGEIKWYIRNKEDHIYYELESEKLDGLNIELKLNLRTNVVIFGQKRWSEFSGFCYSHQKQLVKLLNEIENQTTFVKEICKWIDNYDKLKIEKTSHTWKLPDE